jgi:hypothetical protein
VPSQHGGWRVYDKIMEEIDFYPRIFIVDKKEDSYFRYHLGWLKESCYLKRRNIEMSVIEVLKKSMNIQMRVNN